MGDRVVPKWEPGSPDAEPLYSCAGCYENYSWPHTDLRLGTDGLLWCDDCYEEFRPLDDNGEYATPDYADLPIFLPPWKAEIARLTKLRALDEQQFAKLNASFDEVVRQRDEYRRGLWNSVKMALPPNSRDDENVQAFADGFVKEARTQLAAEKEAEEKALQARQAGEGK